MKRLRLLLLGVAAFVAAAGAAEPPRDLKPAQIDAVVALARLSGAVRYFDPADAVQQIDWDRFLVMASERMLDVNDNASMGPELERLFAPWATGVRIAKPETALPPPPVAIPADRRVEWRHLGYGFGQRPNNPYISFRTQRDKAEALEPELEKAANERPTVARFPLAAGWWASVPLQLDSSAAEVSPEQGAALKSMKEKLRDDANVADYDRALSVAAGITLWSFVRHFYPYWAQVKVDWDQSLRDWIAAQPPRQNRTELLDQLRRLMARIDDGHGNVYDTQPRPKPRFLPIRLRPLGTQWVVTTSDAPEVRAGDVIVTIDGRKAREYIDEKTALVSGSSHHKAWRAAQSFSIGEENQVVKLGIDHAGVRSEVELKRSASRIPPEPRPASQSQLREGIWYVDISRFDFKAFEAALPQMSTARAVIFDLRGYPDGEAFRLAPFWIKDAETNRWMKIPLTVAPFAPPTAFRGFGWDVEPNPALKNVRKILLTDGRAVSFSESLTGYFASQGQGTIVGEPTAGANGNVMFVQLPGAFGASITGMRVTRHDGSVMHGKGFAPDIPVAPTVEGILAGRDEVLERGLQLAAGGS